MSAQVALVVMTASDPEGRRVSRLRSRERLSHDRERH
jgi:hypothetical protein